MQRTARMVSKWALAFGASAALLGCGGTSVTDPGPTSSLTSIPTNETEVTVGNQATTTSVDNSTEITVTTQITQPSPTSAPATAPSTTVPTATTEQKPAPTTTTEVVTLEPGEAPQTGFVSVEPEAA